MFRDLGMQLQAQIRDETVKTNDQLQILIEINRQTNRLLRELLQELRKGEAHDDAEHE